MKPGCLTVIKQWHHERIPKNNCLNQVPTQFRTMPTSVFNPFYTPLVPSFPANRTSLNPATLISFSEILAFVLSGVGFHEDIASFEVHSPFTTECILLNQFKGFVFAGWKSVLNRPGNWTWEPIRRGSHLLKLKQPGSLIFVGTETQTPSNQPTDWRTKLTNCKCLPKLNLLTFFFNIITTPD